MLRPLLWSGKAAITHGTEVAAPRAGEVLVAITHTLCASSTPPGALTAMGRVAEVGAGCMAVDTQVIFRCREMTSALTVPAQDCFPLQNPRAPMLTVPLVADILRALDQAAPDLGWSGIVLGGDALARLATLVAANAGARQVVCHSPEAAAPPPGATATFTDLSGTAVSSLHHVVHRSRGPMVFFDTTGSATVLQAVLDVIPPHSALILLGNDPGDITSINFYQDVHKKSIRIVGAAGGIAAHCGERAERLVQARIPPADTPQFHAAVDTVPAPAAGCFVLAWETPRP
jgi:threonine dehydrogenase-like Zn-dependent dehydrogenase